MKPDEQNAAMAELEVVPPGDDNYLTDLNAVARVEGKLPQSLHIRYTSELLRVTYKEGTLHEGLPIGALNAATAYFLMRATAAQRTEAILRATGKWKEEMLHQ